MIKNKKARRMAQDVLDYIEANPAEHDQRNWSCGTTMCIGGTALYLEHGRGWQKVTDKEIEAGKLLGLSFEEGVALFYDMYNESAIEKLKMVAAGEDIY